MRTRRGCPVAGAVLIIAAMLALVTGCAAGGSRTPAANAATTRPAPSAAPSTPVAAAELPASIVALGDSLSRGFDACSHYGDCTSVSWSTGTDAAVDSVADRLAAARGTVVRRVNVAESGVASDALAGQVDRAIAARPELATVLIGANDVCRADVDAMTPTSVFTDRVRAALDRLAAGVPGITILVASVPNVPDLLPVVGADPTAQFLWSRLGGCTSVLERPESSAQADVDRRAAVTVRIQEYNTALASSCARLPRCVFDDDALFRYRPTVAQISPLDLFHPSLAGLRELAATEWAVLERHWGLS